MAIKIYEKFAPRANPADGDYPYGSIKNESVPGAKDGTPLDAVWANDYAGTDAELFAQAGIVPSGQPDKLGASQRVDALHALFDTYTTVAELATGKFQVGQYVILTDRAMGLFLSQSGGVPNGIDILDAGNGNTAIAQRFNGFFTAGQFGCDTVGTAAVQKLLDKAGSLLIDVDCNATACLVRDDTNLIINKELHNQSHGYHTLVCDGIKNAYITGVGEVTGLGIFPSKTLNGEFGGGEKGYTISQFGVWPRSTGSTDNGIGSFGGGFIGNGGCGIIVKNGCENIHVDVDTRGHNYAGLCVGDPLLVGISELINKNITFGGTHYENYDAGISHHAVEGLTILDSTLCENNGHPDALDSDDEINPGYGITGRLVGNSGISSKDVYIGGHYIGNKRKGVDLHSGTDVRLNIYSKDSFVSGLSLSGNTGSRGKVIGVAIIENSGTAIGALVDAKTAFSISNEYSSVDLKVIARESGKDYGFYVGPNIKRCSLNVDLQSSISNRPFYAQGTLGGEVGLILSGVISGSYSNAALMTFVTSGSIADLNMSGVTYSSGTQDIVMTSCNIDIASGNMWSRPLFNNNNSGYMIKGRTVLSITYNGTSTPSVSFIDGEKYITSQVGTGSGWSFQSLANSDNPAIPNGWQEFSASIDWQSVRPTTGLLYTAAIPGTSGGKEVMTINNRDAANTTLASTSADLNGMTMSVDITWGYQY